MDTRHARRTPTRTVRPVAHVAIAGIVVASALIAPVLDVSGPVDPKQRTIPLDLVPAAAAAATLATGGFPTTAQSAPATAGPGAAATDPDPSADGTPAPATGTAAATGTPTSASTPTSAPTASGGSTGDPEGAQPALSSGVVATPGFDVVGVTWSAEEARDVGTVQVRVRQDGRWSEWFDVDVASDEGPDPGSPEDVQAGDAVVATEPVVAAGADGFEVRVDAAGDAPPETLEAVTLEVPADGRVESGTVPLSSAAAATVPQPGIVTRARWGADESKRRCAPDYSDEVTHAVVHHTAGSNSYSSGQAASVVNGIYAYHTDVLQWCDIGYNFLVDKYGTIYEGRYGGVDRAVRGAHAGGFNTDTFGVAVLGNYEETTLSAAARRGLESILTWKVSLHSMDALGSGPLTSVGGGTARHAAGTTVRLPTIMGHRDVGYTACPGRHVYSQLGSIRQSVAARQPNAAFVQAMYRDLLKRSADPGGARVWRERVDDMGKPAAVRSFRESTEYRQRVISHGYRVVLGREPDAQGLAVHTQRVADDQQDLDTIQVTFLLSDEAWRRGGSTPEGYVQLLYRIVLGRSIDPAGARTWPDHVRSQGRAATVERIWESNEAVTRRVDSVYREFLGRGVDPLGRETWVPVARTDGTYTVLDRVMASREYEDRARRRF
jgi:hypothetical protein